MEQRNFVPEGYATGAAKGLTKADLPDHTYWKDWFPATWVSEMREQIRLWFYAQLFMSVVLTDTAPLPNRARLREDARRARTGDARLLGQRDQRRRCIRADGRRRDALAVLQQPPSQNLLFGFGLARKSSASCSSYGTA